MSSVKIVYSTVVQQGRSQFELVSEMEIVVSIVAGYPFQYFHAWKWTIISKCTNYFSLN